MEEEREQETAGQSEVYTPERLEAKANRDIDDKDNETKEIKAGTRYQRRHAPRHRIEEHLIALQSLIMQRMKNQKWMVVQIMDFKKFFDLERLRAIMAGLNIAKVNSKASCRRLLAPAPFS